MAVLMLSFLVLATVLECRGTLTREPGNFPLDGCFTDELDILFLYFDNDHADTRLHQKILTDSFARGIIDLRDNDSMAMFADIHDFYSTNNPNVNVSDFKFFDSFSLDKTLEEEKRHKWITGLNQEYGKRKSNNINDNIYLKIQFVQRLFSDINGVRERATHVAVIFLDGTRLSFEESKSIPDILQQQQQATDIKMFVVAFDVIDVEDIVYFRDTLLVGYPSGQFSAKILLMAVCNKCWQGWFSLHKINNDYNYMSCYYLDDLKTTVSWDYALRDCEKNSSYLANIETKEELVFLQTQLSRYLQDILKQDNYGSSQFSTQFFIGLRRYPAKHGKYFHWLQNKPFQTRPLVINHWLPGKPSGGFNSGCGVWRFVWNDTADNVINNSDNHFVDGWVDVECRSEISSLSLCEVSLPRRIDDMDAMRIKPAMNKSVDEALTKGDLMIFRNNIVSISANIAREDFRDFRKHTHQQSFPMFECGVDVPDPRYISYFFVCDSIDHCSNRRDELFCDHDSQLKVRNENILSTCGSDVSCCDYSCLPLQWVGDGEVDCQICGFASEENVNDESDYVVNFLKGNDNCAIICNDICIHFSWLNGIHWDCIGYDVPLNKIVGRLETVAQCNQTFGYRIWAPRCVYIREMYGGVLGCRDMSHLDNCEDFVCPEGYFKCPNNYCIPQHYVLDGTADCPNSEEENNYTIASCEGNFACWNSKMCLHPDLVCDGHSDCPHQDDEIDCYVYCLEGLRCQSGTLMLSDYIRNMSEENWYNLDKRIRYINVSGGYLLRAIFYSLPNVAVFILSHCNLSNDKMYHTLLPRGLQYVDMSYNLLQSLDGYQVYDSPFKNVRHWNLSYNKDIFEVRNFQLQFLETLDLSHTSLLLLDVSLFVQFPSLKHLNLSFTKITNIYNNTFPLRLVLQTLDLRGLFIVDFYEDFFNGLTISQDLFSDSFEFCCPQIRGTNIPYHTCHAPDDAISSCFDLVSVHVQRVLLWVVAVLAVLGNVMVIGYRVIWEKSVLRKGYGLFVTNLGVSDFIMGVYLFIIAGADYYYRDVYVLYDKSWRESVVCKLAGFLATLSIETSTFFVFLITLDRFLMMKFPFRQVKFSKVSTLIALSLSWIIGFLLALTPIVFRFEIYSSNSMCLGLPLTTERLNGWEFSFAVFVVLNFCLVLFVLYGQRAIFRAMSQNRATSVASRLTQDIMIAKQLSLVALCTFLCWFPVGIMSLLSIAGHEISNDVYSWTMVVVLPINSAANPLLYTIPAITAKWKQFKSGVTRTLQTSH